MNRSNVGSHLSKRAELASDQEAVVDVAEGRRFTYGEMNERADRFARALLGLGLTRGARVAVLLPNGYRFIEIYYGAARAGLILVPINLRLVPDEVAYILRDAGAAALISGESHVALAADLHGRRGSEAVPVEHWIAVGKSAIAEGLHYDALLDAAAADPVVPTAGGDDPMFIMYTSGTTGRPKGTIQTHESIEWSLLTVVAATDMRYRDRYLISLPLYHIAAFNNMGTTLYRGGVVVILQKFEAEETWRVLRDERINITLAVPAMLTQLLAVYDSALYQPLSLRWILTGAQPMPLHLLNAFETLGFRIYQAYGLTEAGGVGCCMMPEDAPTHIGSIGKGFFHTEVRVVDPQTGVDCAANVAGELVIRGKHVMAGYWNLPEQTSQTLREDWLHTGDVAVRDAKGFFYIRDRLKDMIISGGENIYPAEIEVLLSAHPEIAEVSVIGVPSERWGESPLAVVVRKDGALSAAAVREYCVGKIAKFKIPAAVCFIDQIPRNATGKALKTILRERYAAGNLR
jgi:acyl-CoA synthetase (AMP-forming)/AMP-acid ligase II